MLVEDNPLALDDGDYNLEARVRSHDSHMTVTWLSPPSPLPLPPPQVCFLEFSEIVCDLSYAFYPRYKRQQLGGGGKGDSLGRAPSGEQEGEAGEVEDQDSHLGTSSQPEREDSFHLDHQEGGCHTQNSSAGSQI